MGSAFLEHVQRSGLRALALAGAALQWSCASSAERAALPDRLEATRLRDGVTVGSLARARGGTAVLIFAPSDCFACATDLDRWNQIRLRDSTAVRILLTRSPSDAERDQLRRLRVHISGVLAGAEEVEDLVTPALIVFQDAQLSEIVMGMTQMRQRGMIPELIPAPR